MPRLEEVGQIAQGAGLPAEQLLQLGLDAKRSPWSDAVTALRLTLPTLSGTQLEAVQKLLAEGPPNEDVGLDAYSLDPQLNPHPAADADFEGALR